MKSVMEHRSSRMRVEHLDVADVLSLVQKEGFGEEFQLFVKEKNLDGLKLLNVTEGILKLWRPKINSKKFLHFIEDLQKNPNKYLNDTTIRTKATIEYKDNAAITISNSVESQYQTVTVKRVREEVITATSKTKIEDIFNKLVPTKSFLYPNKKGQEKPISPYVPMNVGKKPRRYFSFSYDYPLFDLRKLKFYKNEKFNDRGYYVIKTTTETDVYDKQTDEQQQDHTANKEPADTNSMDIVLEDHFYEDLCYNDVKDNKVRKRSNSLDHSPTRMPGLLKIHEIFQTIKLPFLKRGDDMLKKKEKDVQVEKDDSGPKSDVNLIKKEVNSTAIYENAECCSNMYDSVQIRSNDKDKFGSTSPAPVSEYLEPIRLQKDYCDVTLPRNRDDSFLGFIMSIFGGHFGIGKETSDQSDDSDAAPAQSPVQKWNPQRKSCGDSMAARPLPVPVDQEPYYMNVDRAEAEALLAGQPDGTFILRPSSQPNHAYTLTVACSSDVHNVGIRRRPDGRLALGFARRGERCFTTVSSLLRHHQRRRLLLVAEQGLIGATTLKEPPVYYQTPSSLPICQVLPRPNCEGLIDNR